MRKAVGHHATARLTLQTVVPDGRSRIERFLQVTRFENAFLLHVVTPDARKAVGLQFHSHLNAVRFLFGGGLLGALHLLGNTDQRLHMVAHFVREHVTQRKVAPAAQFCLHILIKG